MRITKRPLPSLVACFCLTREEIVPRMFGTFLQHLRSAKKEVATFLWYLRRHVELDTKTHGPLSRALLAVVVGDNPKKLKNALVTVSAALKARRAYLDATYGAIRAGGETGR